MRGNGAIDYSTATGWVERIHDGHEESGKSDFSNRPRCGRPSSAKSSANIDQADELIKDSRRITINELAGSLGVRLGSAVKIVDTQGYSKVCARWVPRQLTEAHEQSCIKTCSELLQYCHCDKNLLQRIVTGDGTWVHYFEPDSN